MCSFTRATSVEEKECDLDEDCELESLYTLGNHIEQWIFELYCKRGCQNSLDYWAFPGQVLQTNCCVAEKCPWTIRDEKLFLEGVQRPNIRPSTTTTVPSKLLPTTPSPSQFYSTMVISVHDSPSHTSNDNHELKWLDSFVEVPKCKLFLVMNVFTSHLRC